MVREIGKLVREFFFAGILFLFFVTLGVLSGTSFCWFRLTVKVFFFILFVCF